jgi:hypothetical protein
MVRGGAQFSFSIESEYHILARSLSSVESLIRFIQKIIPISNMLI